MAHSLCVGLVKHALERVKTYENNDNETSDSDQSVSSFVVGAMVKGDRQGTNLCRVFRVEDQTRFGYSDGMAIRTDHVGEQG